MNFLTACRAFSLSYPLFCPSYGPARCSRPVSSDRCSRGRAQTCMSGVDLLLAAQCQYHPPGPLLNAEEAEALHDEGPGGVLILPDILLQPANKLLLGGRDLEAVHKEARRVLPHLQVEPEGVEVSLGPSPLAYPASLASSCREGMPPLGPASPPSF